MVLLLAIIIGLIFIHELGHYVAGRLSGFGIEEFAIGFGKELASFNALGNKWSFRLIPLGGYVRFEGEADYDNVLQSKTSFWGKHPLQRLFVALAGPAANLLLPYALFFVYFHGMPWPDVKAPDGSEVGKISAYWAAKASINTTNNLYASIGEAVSQLGDRGIKATDVGGPVAMYDMTEQARKQSSSTKDNGFLYQWIAFLSINIGFMNLLPIPLLDGGHVVISIVETVIGRNIKRRTRNILSYVGLAIVGLIMCLAIFSDVGRLFS
jgi:membrane-associated protease RseP (regulator of RpoE activity)|tara:strand:- start:906 stop:1706 length:801 start_codon:yes stop_codon:yes gene_type:complete